MPSRIPPLTVVHDILHALRADGHAAVVGGSGLLVSLGLADVANDWDVVVDAEPEQVLGVLGTLGLTFTVQPRTGSYRTAALIRVGTADHQIDVMVRFALADGDRTVRIPARPGATWRGLVMADPRDWVVAYRLMGRTARAEALHALLERDAGSSTGVSQRS